MDKETLSNYGWIVICVLVMAVMIALATPFGTFIGDAVWNTMEGLFYTGENALLASGVIPGEPVIKTASGSCLYLSDISSEESSLNVHLTSDTLTDFSSVKIKKLGKNLMSFADFTSGTIATKTTANGILSLNVKEDVSTKTLISESDFTSYYNGIKTLPAGTYSFSANSYYSSGGGAEIHPCLRITLQDGTSDLIVSGVPKTISQTFTLKSIALCNLDSNVTPTEGATLKAGFTYETTFQLEYSDTATEYEPFITPVEYTANADGTVTGITPQFPVTTLISDAENVTINCEYKSTTLAKPNDSTDGSDDAIEATGTTYTPENYSLPITATATTMSNKDIIQLEANCVKKNKC